ncbi:glycosyltransferase 8 domain-containing protein 1-like isoform X2 [Lineus longissimus]|uniref:glycosyltransferase 8 domain-containing protein 1-like isoform X2 n=1 Tax=Lineus longissimus TaxID=88925 RepID=UPI00315D0FB1
MLKKLGSKKVVMALVFLAFVFYCYLILDDHKSIRLRSGPKKTGRHGVPKIKLKLRNRGSADELTTEPAVLQYNGRENMIDQGQSITANPRRQKDPIVIDVDIYGGDPPIPILLTADHERIGGMITAINSIRLNTKHVVHFYLLVDEESLDHVRTWIKSTDLKSITYKIKVFDASTIASLIVMHGTRQDLESPLNFARFFVLDYFPELTSRFVYIDTDTIVQGDIWTLYNTPIQQGYYGAFSDDCSSVSKRFSMHLNYYASYLNFNNPFVRNLRMNAKQCSFDIGVFVADAERWATHNVSAQVKYWLNMNKQEVVFGRSKGVGPVKPPALIVFYKKITALNPLWNVRNLGQTTGTLYSDSFVRSAKLIHWNGIYKPWKRLSQFQDIWDQYYIQDPTDKFLVVRKAGNI